ncbi:hypothetical protein CCMA1212_007458 [Trichoderma ghanense]|uniref:Uncharacterized protein n=1 Tax=Trichoderma ghanense TaxID=65468 RepID=A0ABY2GYR9_9HYPO
MSSHRELRDNPDNTEAPKGARLNAVLDVPGTESEPQVLRQHAARPPPPGRSFQNGIWADEIKQLLAIEHPVGKPEALPCYKAAIKAAFKYNLEEFRQHFPDHEWAEPLVSMATNPTFKKWLEHPDSQFLVVRKKEKASPDYALWTLSYALLGLGDEENQEEIARQIAFFCGSHLHKTGIRDSSQLIMREITHQILELLEFLEGEKWLGCDDTDFIAVRTKLEQKDPDTILSALRMIVTSMIDGTMYVFIDGLCRYEGTPFEEGANATIKALNDLVNDMVGPRMPRIKVLIIQPSPQQQKSWGFEAETIKVGCWEEKDIAVKE